MSIAIHRLRPVRWIAASAALAACVVTGGLVASGGGDGRGASPVGASGPGVTVRANVDPLTSIASAQGQIAQLQNVVRARPDDAQATARLGLAYLQVARESFDPAEYERADTLLNRARRIEPTNLDATLGLGSLALSRHDFSAALHLGRDALRLSDGYSPSASAIVGDAQIELGRYDQGFATVDRLGEVRPSLVSWARQSYAAELRGDLALATRYMRQAVESGAGAGANTQWTRVQYGNLLLKQGRIDEAEREFRHALAALPTFAKARAGLGAVAVARGDLASAEQEYQQAAAIVPLPEILIALGDVQTARGQRDAARATYGLVRIEQRLYQQAGGNADLELALFEANHGDPKAAVVLARRAVAARPSIFSHDALAWALERNGDCRAALAETRLATALGTAEPLLDWHHGAIAACAGKTAEARAALTRALRGNAAFHPIDAPAAHTLLTSLGDVA